MSDDLSVMAHAFRFLSLMCRVIIDSIGDRVMPLVFDVYGTDELCLFQHVHRHSDIGLISGVPVCMMERCRYFSLRCPLLYFAIHA